MGIIDDMMRLPEIADVKRTRMRTKIHKSIRYSNYRVIAYTGYMGSGMTLAAIMQLAKEGKRRNPLGIVSNLPLVGIDYEPFQISDMLDYRDKLILVDSAGSYMAVDSRRSNSSINNLFIQFCRTLKKRNNRVIIATSHMSFVDSRIRDMATQFVCEFTSELNMLVLRRRDTRRRNLVHVYPNLFMDDYFKYYDALRMAESQISEFLGRGERR